MNDADLLAALRRRDPDAFSVLFEAYSDKVYRLALGMLEDEAEAEGVVQDAFLRLFERLDQFEARSKLSTWLYRVAYNLTIDRLRKRRPTLSMDDPDTDELPLPQVLVDWRQWPERILSDEELTAELDKAIASLPEKYRAVFMLREIEGLSVAETAVITHVTPANVKVRLHRARLLLRERLAESMMASAR
jgi:RNA polymerase sigma-70 factor (ECF subfamily)